MTDSARHKPLWRMAVLFLIDSTAVGLLGYALWLFLDYWQDYMSSNLEKTGREVWLSREALNPLSYAHQGQQALLLFVCLAVFCFSGSWHLISGSRRLDRSPNVSQPQAAASNSGARIVKRHSFGKVAGVIDIIGGAISLLTALLSWMALPLVNSPLNGSAAVLFAASGAVAIIGGLSAFQGRNRGVAIAGALGTTAGLWPLGLLALVFTILSGDGIETRQSSGRNA